MLSISIGLFAGLAVLSLYKGMMKSRIRTLIETEIGHLQLHDSAFKKDFDPRFIIPKGNEVWNYLLQQPELINLSARTSTSAMLSAASGSAGVQVYGIVPDDESHASKLNEKIISGELFPKDKKSSILLGKKLAKKLKLKTGSRVVLMMTDSSGSMVSGAFKVRGIYESSNAALDEINIYVQREEVNPLLLLQDDFHEISLQVKPDADLLNMQERLQNKFPHLLVESWHELSPETDLMARTVDEMSYIIIVIILFALSFGIINTMLMAVLERTREVGMMIALGTSRIRIFSLIFLETLFLTLASSPVGLGISWIIISYYHKKGLDLSNMGKEMMSSFGFETTIYPE